MNSIVAKGQQSTQDWSSTQENLQSNISNWPTTNYDQYYNYYQTVQQANELSTPSTATPSTNAPASVVDYSKAWEEYYKAYYGQNYSVTTPTSNNQPYSGYSYDQYTNYYSNTNYYTNPSTNPSHSTPVETSTPYTYTDTSANYSFPTATTNWNQPPPDYSQPVYSQPQINVGNSNFSQTNSASNQPLPEPIMEKSYCDFSENYGEIQEVNCAYDKEEDQNYMERFPPPHLATRSDNFSRGRGRVVRPPPTPRFTMNAQPNKLVTKNTDTSQNDSELNKGSKSIPSGHFQPLTRGFSSIIRKEDTLPPVPRHLIRPQKLMEINTNYNEHENFRVTNNDNKFPIRRPYNDKQHLSSKITPRGISNGFNSKFIGPQMISPKTDVERVDKEDMKIQDLMNIDFNLTHDMSIIQRRQNIINNWRDSLIQSDDNNYSPLDCIKEALGPDVQSMLQISCFHGLNNIICELYLDDIFLIQAYGDTENQSIQNASKELYDMLKENYFYVVSASRYYYNDVVPGFTISIENSSVQNLPTIPIHRLTPSKQSDSNIQSNPTNQLYKTNQLNPTNLSNPTNPSNTINQSNSTNKSNSTNPLNSTNLLNPTEKNVKKVELSKPVHSKLDLDPLVIVLDESGIERDQSISILNATAKFNDVCFEFKHEKKPQSPHISQCIITLNGEEIGRSEARDYLVAKRQVAEGVLEDFKNTKSIIGFRFDKARIIMKSELQLPNENAAKIFEEFLLKYMEQNDDMLLRFGADYLKEERAALLSVLPNLNLSSKSDLKSIFVFRQYPPAELKKRILNNGFCAQFQLIEKAVFEN